MGCRVVRLGDVVQINARQYSAKENWDRIQYLDTGSVVRGSVSGLQQLMSGRDKVPSRAKRKVKDKSIVYSMVRPNQAHYALLDNPPSDMLVSTGFSVIDAIETIVSPGYLYYALTAASVTERFQALAEQCVSTYPTLSIDDLCSLELKLPDLCTQKKIESLIGAFDKKAKLNARLNDYLAEMLLAKYDQLFGPFSPDKCNGTLADLGEVVGGATPSKKKEEFYCHDGIGWITPRDLSNTTDVFISHGADDISQAGYDSCSAKLMPKGSVLFSSRAPIGYLAIASDEVTTNQGFKSVVPKPEIGTAFVYCFLQRNKQRIADMGAGTTFPEVSGKTMKGVELELPGLEECAELTAFATPILAMIQTNECENRELAALRDVLLPKLMSGEIDVSKVDLTQLNNH